MREANEAATCYCGHIGAVHAHYRASTHCSICGPLCLRFRRATGWQFQLAALRRRFATWWKRVDW